MKIFTFNKNNFLNHDNLFQKIGKFSVTLLTRKETKSVIFVARQRGQYVVLLIKGGDFLAYFRGLYHLIVLFF